MTPIKGLCIHCGKATGSTRRSMCEPCLLERKRLGGRKGGRAPKERDLSEDEVRSLLDEGEQRAWNFEPGWRSRRAPE